VLAKAVALCEAARHALLKAASPRAGTAASKLLATLAGHQRSLGATHRTRYESPARPPAPPRLDDLLNRATTDDLFEETRGALQGSGDPGARDGLDLKSAMDLALADCRRIAAFWTLRLEQAGEPDGQAFLRDVEAQSRGYLDELSRLAERMGLVQGGPEQDASYRSSIDALLARLDTDRASSALQVTPELLTGIPGIDDQHRELLAIAGKVLERGALQLDDEVVDRLVPYLTSYAEYHFAAEELTMKVFRFPGLKAHRERHDRFRERFRRLVEAAHPGDASGEVRNVMSFLLALLLHHFRTDDRALAGFLAQMGADPARFVRRISLEQGGLHPPEPPADGEVRGRR